MGVRAARLALTGHVAMMAFGAAGILLALPNPEWWQGDAAAQRAYEFGMRHGGAVQIWLGAAAMAAWAAAALGARRVAVFAAAAVGVSLTAELFGTKTGWPFGGYAYLDGLGTKVLGRVPYTIPMSWFFMGLASYVLGSALAARLFRGRTRTAGGLLMGAWLLVAWDLVLDPAMAHESLPVRFWVWLDEGRYFGMPLQNFAGWMATGLTFMAISRIVWRQDAAVGPEQLGIPLACYLANIAFASAIALGVGLWQPVAVAVPAAVLPALAAGARTPRAYPVGRRFVRAAAALLLRRLELEVEGRERLPAEGPAVIAARHVHHLYDGVILTALLPRPPSILVALDWAGNGVLRRTMELLCRMAGWPAVDRVGRGADPTRPVDGLRDALERLCRGEIVAMFPEGRPVYDPHAGDRPDEVLPFQRGATWLAARAAQRLGRPVPLVPVALLYERPDERRRTWRVTVRVGESLAAHPGAVPNLLTHELEEAVRELSSSRGEQTLRESVRAR